MRKDVGLEIIKRKAKDKAFLVFENKIVGYPNYKNKVIKIFSPDKK